MRRRWIRYFLWKKYMMRCCQCKKNDEKDENGRKCFCHHHRFCRKPGSCKMNSQEEKVKNENENNNENSPQAIEEEEEEKE